MLPFSQFLTERVRYPYLFHGTSSAFRADIKRDGLTSGFRSGKEAKQDGVYLTTDFDLAVREAKFTVEGENGEEGAGGSPVVVVVKRDHPSLPKLRLNRDQEYHPYEPFRKSTAFWTEHDIPAAAILDIVRPSEDKYRAAHMQHLTKQVGAMDSEGNPIIDQHGKAPELISGGKLVVYFRSDEKSPQHHDAWSTSREAEYFGDPMGEDGKPRPTWMIIAMPRQFTVVDQTPNEALVKPNAAAFNTYQRCPEKYRR